MKESVCQLLHRMHMESHNQLTHYRFNKHKDYDERYRAGRVTALEWLCSLSSHYMEREKRVPDEISQVIQHEMKKIETLRNTPYRQGIEDAIKEFVQNYLQT